MPNIADYYKVLHVDYDADIGVIISAYKSLAFKYTQGKSNNSEIELSMKIINEAYEILKDQINRVVYDRILKNQKSQNMGSSHHEKE